LIDTIHLYDLVNGNIDMKGSDILTINDFAKQHNITLEELKKELLKFSQIFSKNKDYFSFKLWINTIDKAIKAKDKIVDKGTYNILNTKLYINDSDNRTEYRARIFKSKDDNKNIIQFVSKVLDLRGESTGEPNTYYWEGTPGIYNIETILNIPGDIIYIDRGINWSINGLTELKREIKEKYNLLTKNESYKVKFIKDFSV
jgi:hypothetical protein